MNNETGTSIEFRDIFNAVKRRVYIVVLFVILATLLALYYVTYKITPLYESTTRVIIGNSLDSRGTQFRIEEVVNIQELMATYTALTKTTSISEKTLKKLKMEIPTEMLENSVTAIPQLATQFMDLRLVWTDAKEGIKILDTFTQVYISEVKKIYPTFNIKVMEKAKMLGAVIQTSKKIYILLGVFTGIAVAFLLILVLEIMDNTLKSEVDVKARLELTVIGMIPKHKKKIRRNSLELIPKFNYVFREAYRTLRTNIYFAAYKEKARIIAITSARPGEGKTTVACMLSKAIAQDGKKTILLDCDLRKPQIHNLFKLEQSGVSDILLRDIKWRNVVQNSDIENLDIIAAGDFTSNPSELLSLRRMKELVEALEKEYEYIILDTPPVGLFTDAQILSQCVDKLIFVVSIRKTNIDEAIKAKSLIQQTDDKILGVVINGMDDLPFYRYYTHYRKAEMKNTNIKSSIRIKQSILPKYQIS